MKLCDLLYEDEYQSTLPLPDIEINKISTSKDDIIEGSLFILTKSINFDISKILNYILSKKPKVILCEPDVEISSDKILILRTENIRKILPYILIRFYGINLDKMRFLGITGTCGKTSTATMIYHILTYAGKRCAFIGTGKIIINGKTVSNTTYSMTTPDPIYLYSILRIAQESDCSTIIMEVSSHALYFDKVLPITFDISVFTNLSPEHMDFHRDMEDYYNTKMKLFSQSKLGIFNNDDFYSRRAFNEAKCQKTSIGIIYPADSVAKNIEMNGFLGSEYIFTEEKRLFKIRLNIGGAFNLYNSLLAIKAASEFGIAPTILKKAISELEVIEGRMELINQSPTVIIDYAHTDVEMESALKFINSAKKPKQKVITIFGCGGERDKQKRPKMAKVAEKYSNFVIVTTDNSRGESETEIFKDILRGFENVEKRKVIVSRKGAIEYALQTSGADDIIILMGKGHERYNIDRNGYQSFDERAIVKRASEEVGIIRENSY